MNFIDLFAGAGGLSEGFIRAGFKPIAHVEADTAACFTLKTRASFYYLKENKKLSVYKSYLKGKINREKLYSHIPNEILDSVINEFIGKENNKKIFSLIDKQIGNEKVDVIIGGPPCQTYSVVGRARDPNNMENDQRNFLYQSYVKFLVKYKPKLFVFENVPGILSAKNGEHFTKIQKAIDKAGYNFKSKILNAKDFGVLQDRKRVILIGWRKKLKFDYPEFAITENKFQLLKDLFSDLPKLKQGTGKHFTAYKKPINKYLSLSHIRNGINFTTQHIARPHNERDLEIYRIAIEKWIKNKKRLNYAELPERLKTHKNETSFVNRFQVVDPYSISHTVVAHISCDGHYYIYPDLKQIRSISIREAARIQSFPDDYYFEGEIENKNRTVAFKQIGNAVPPLMAEGIAKEIKHLL